MTITIFISFDIMSLYTVNKRKQIKRIPMLFYGKLHINTFILTKKQEVNNEAMDVYLNTGFVSWTIPSFV